MNDQDLGWALLILVLGVMSILGVVVIFTDTTSQTEATPSTSPVEIVTPEVKYNIQFRNLDILCDMNLGVIGGRYRSTEYGDAAYGYMMALPDNARMFEEICIPEWQRLHGNE